VSSRSATSSPLTTNRSTKSKKSKKVIKDGAYTIVVEDTSLSTKRSSRSLKSSFADGEDSDSGSDFYSDDNEELEQAGEEEEEDDENMWEVSSESSEEEIDYKDTKFILANLKIAVPNFAEDSSYVLPGRADLAKIICRQVRFYCYCAFDAFTRFPKSVNILVIGEGFLGSRIVKDLISYGCRDMLRICTRGDLTAEEWRKKGVKASNEMATLIDGNHPDIIILAVENASFTSICRQLVNNYIVTRSSFVISCSFGFQRRKLFTQLSCPTILRTFVEPAEIYQSYKSDAAKALAAMASRGSTAGGGDLGTRGSMKDAAHGPVQDHFPPAPVSASARSGRSAAPAASSSPSPLAPSSAGGSSSRRSTAGATTRDTILLSGTGVGGGGVFAPISESARRSGTTTGDDDAGGDPVNLLGMRDPSAFNAATYLADRSVNIQNFSQIIENYYTIQHHGFEEARHKALKNVYGSESAASRIPEQPELLEDLQRQLETVSSRHNSSYDDNYELMSLRKYLRTQSKLKNKIESAMRKFRDTNSISTFQEVFRQRIDAEQIELLEEEPFTEEQNNPQTGPNVMKKPHLDAHKGSMQNPLRSYHTMKPGLSMYTDLHIRELFAYDDNYSLNEGPGFDLMRSWDFPAPNVLSTAAPAAAAAAAENAENAKTSSNAGASPSIGTGGNAHSPARGTTPNNATAVVDRDVDAEVREFNARMSTRVKDIDSARINRNYMETYVHHANNM